MATALKTSAAQFLPQHKTLVTLREAAASCKGCPLYERGTQTVFGEGGKRARLMLIGEQPGNDEDLAGRPFVGPAGRILDEALEQVGIARADTYVTNVVKHFKWVAQGRRRLHQKPNAKEVGACLPWLESEIEVIKPHIIVCLGATAATALLGPKYRVSTQRGTFVPSPLAPRVTATVHPSSILRAQSSEDRRREMRWFIADFERIAEILKQEAA